VVYRYYRLPQSRAIASKVGRPSDHLKISHPVLEVQLSIQPPVAPRFISSGLWVRTVCTSVYQYGPVSPHSDRPVLCAHWQHKYSQQLCSATTGPQKTKHGVILQYLPNWTRYGKSPLQDTIVLHHENTKCEMLRAPFSVHTS
jgi:hypothetical protein